MSEQERENPDPHALIQDVYLLIMSENLALEINDIEEKIICYVQLSKDGFWLQDLETLSRVFVILSFLCENKVNERESLKNYNLDDYFRRILLRLLSVAHRPIRMHFPSDWINGPFALAKYLASLASILTNEALLNDDGIGDHIPKRDDSSLLNYKFITEDFKHVKYEVKELMKRMKCKVKKNKKSYLKMERNQQRIIEKTKEWLKEQGRDKISEKDENSIEEKVINIQTYDDDIGSIYTEITDKNKRKKKKHSRIQKHNDILLPSNISDGSCKCNIESDNLEWDTLEDEEFEAEVEEEGLDYSFDSGSRSSEESTITESSMTSSTPSRHWSSTISYSEMNKEENISIKSEEIQLLVLNSLHSLLINKKRVSTHDCCFFYKNYSNDYCCVTEEQARTAMDYGSFAARISDALTLLKNKVFIFCAKLATLLAQKSFTFAMTLVKRGNINTVLLRQYLFYKRGIPLEQLPDDPLLIIEQMVPPTEDRILESQESGRLLWQLLATVKKWQTSTKSKQPQTMETKEKHQEESYREDNASLIKSCSSSNIFESEEIFKAQNPDVCESICLEENTEQSFRMLNCENYRIHENNPHNTRGTKMPKIIGDKSKNLCDVSHMDFQDYYNYNYNLSTDDLKCSEKEMEENDELENIRFEQLLSFSSSITPSSSIYDSSISTPDKGQFKLCSYCRCPLNIPMRDALEATKSLSEETSLEANDFETRWNHWLMHHDILSECPGPASAALEALILHCKWMILIGNKIERNNLLAQIIMILKLWKHLPISRGHIDCLLTSLCVCEESAEMATNAVNENSHKTPETPKWSYQSPGSPISKRAEDFRAQQLALIGSTIIVQNHNSSYFHKKFQVLENVCKKMKPCKEPEDKLFCEHCGKLPTNYEWDYILVMIVCSTMMAKKMIDCYISGEGIKYLVALIGYLRNVVDMERPKTVLINALLALLVLLEHFEDNSFLRESAIEANAINILLHILKSLTSENMRRLNSFWEENITIYCLSSLTILIRRNDVMLTEYAQEFLQVSLSILKICPPQISNELLICFLDLCWEGVIWNPEALKGFVDQCGAYLLLDLLDHVIYPIVTQILGILADMAYDGGCIPHLVTWRSKKTGLTLYPFLLNIWRSSEEMMNVERDQYGIIANLKQPLVPSLIHSKHVVSFIGSARSKIYAILQILENDHKDKVDLCNETYRIGLSPPLSLTDEITLVLARNYLALTTAELSSMNLRNTQEKSLLFKDNFLIQLIAKHFENDIEDVRREQLEILDKLKAEEKNEEKVLYKKLEKALVPAINENNRIVDKMARTSDRSKMLKAKEAQRTEINKELCFPLSAGPEHCHRTYQEHFTPTVFSGKHFLLKSIKDVLREEPPRPVSPITYEKFEDIFPEEIYNPLVKDGFKEYR